MMYVQPANSSDDPFKRLKDRVRRRMQESAIGEKMHGLVRDAHTAYVEVLKAENIILTRAEHERLFRAFMKGMLDDALMDL